MTKKLYDLNIDEEKIIQDWCDTAVGKKAGVYLRKYYDFWEKYWQRPEIQRTAWGKRRTGTYMPLGELPSHTYALRKGDMKYLRSLIDKVISLAGTDKEKRRAKILEDCFEISYLASKILFSEIFTPEGTLQSVEDVLALLKAVPESLEAMDKFHKNPYAKHYRGIGKLESAQLAAISMVQRYMHDKRVRAEVAKLEKKVKKPMLRAILKIWQGAKVKNLIVNGSFEAASPKPAKRGRWEGKVVRDQKIVSHGKYSLRLPQNCSFEYQIKTEPGKTYLFMMDLYGNESSLEGVVDYVLSPVMGRIVVGHTRYIDSKIPGGRWVTLSGVCSPVQNYRTKTWSDYMKIWITVRKFEKEEKIYLDNIRFICLDDVK